VTKLWCLTCGRQCLPRLLEHLYRVHVCVYAIRGLEGCPFGSICIIQRLDVTQSIQAYLHYVKEIIRDVKSYIFTLTRSATIPKLNQGLETNIHWTPLKVYLKCIQKED